jgi:hypothetical protein
MADLQSAAEDPNQALALRERISVEASSPDPLDFSEHPHSH